MDERTLAGLAYALAAAVLVGGAVFAYRREAHNPTVALSLSGALLGAAWWAAADGVAVAASGQLARAVGTLAAPTGVAVMVSAFVVFALAIAVPRSVPGPRVLMALFAEPVLITLAAATNPWHLWVYGGLGAGAFETPDAWTHGPLYRAHTVYRFLLIAVGVVLLVRSWWKAQPTFRLQRLALLPAAIVPVGINFAFAAGKLGDLVDPGPLVIAGMAGCAWIWIARQDVRAFSPVARALILDQIGDAIMVVNPVGRVVDVNPAGARLMRRLDPKASREVGGAAVDTLFRTGIAAIQDGETQVSVELEGGEAELHVRSSRLVDRRGRFLGSVLLTRDVTDFNSQSRRLLLANAELESLRADLVEQASRDPLTGLHNRRHLVERFGELLAAAREADLPLAVALFDIDHFKAINDLHGHLVGDEVLVAVAHQLRAQCPPGALVARWGGEEFFVALPGADAEAAFAVAERIREQRDRDAIDVPSAVIRCTLSAGVAAYPAAGVTMNALFHCADVALYEAKLAGRNRVLVHANHDPVSAHRP